MHLTLPVTLSREGHDVRLGQHGKTQCAGHGIERVLASHAGQVNRLPRPPCVLLSRGMKEFLAVAPGQQGKDEIAPRVDVVDRDEEFPEARLAQVLRQQFGIPPAETGRRRQRERRRSSNQVPQGSFEPAHDTYRRPWSAEQTAPPRTPHPAAAARSAEQRPGGRRRQRQHDEHEHQRHQPRQHRGQRSGSKGPRHQPGIRRHEPLAGLRADHLHQEPQRIRDQASSQDEDGNGQDGACRGQERGGDGQGRTPTIEAGRRAAPPDAVRLPHRRRAVNRGQHRSRHAHASAAHDVDLDAGFLKRPEDAGVIGAGCPGAGQQKSGSKMRGVAVAECRWPISHALAHRQGSLHTVHASSWMVRSFRISNCLMPPGVGTLISSPTVFPTIARPIGELVEISPFSAFASSGMTSW